MDCSCSTKTARTVGLGGAVRGVSPGSGAWSNWPHYCNARTPNAAAAQIAVLLVPTSSSVFWREDGTGPCSGRRESGLPVLVGIGLHRAAAAA